MPFSQFDRKRLKIKSLGERHDRLQIEKISVPVTEGSVNLRPEDKKLIRTTAERIRRSRSEQRPVIIAFGAHTIKNGLGQVLIAMIRDGWATHLATNGAGIIHDWEFAFRGTSGEDVRTNVKNGQFGIWEETGFYINLALVTGAFEGLGYGESVGKMISREGLDIPDPKYLISLAKDNIEHDPEHAAAAADLTGVISRNNLKPGFLSIPHPYKEYSVQCSAFENEIPFTGHPMFGHDIIYTHPVNNGAAIGRTALTDFLVFTQNVSKLENGVYLSIGSSVMSPMIFEKALSMAQNIEIQHNRHIDKHFILVVDLAESEWDWKKAGEPPADNPAYYLRYCKTFNRMGGEMHYLRADNRDFLLELYKCLSA